MDFYVEVKKRYSYLCSQDVQRIVDKAKTIFYMLKYPCEPNASEETRPIDCFAEQNWVLMACDELIERLGFGSAVGYKENGVSWSFDNAQVSYFLMGLIKPTVGVI